ncbi:GGDEF domain-containing protein [Sphingosinicellaceae bacterium]|nr:GGDEF domain-containing protein [Sphingosinicellaceae bacterium]
MTDQAGLPQGSAGEAVAGRTRGGLGHPRLLLFDSVRAMLVASGLPPETSVIDLLMRHAEGDDPLLSAAVSEQLAEPGLDLAGVAALRRAHCGDLPPGEVAALVEAAYDQAEALTARLAESANDAARYGEAIAAGDAALRGPDLRGPAPDAAALARLIDRLGQATATMLVANSRLEAELTLAAHESARLRDKLRTAETVAVTDPLTGVLNRRGAFRRLEAAQAASTALSVAMVDIDHFKRVNDRFGHAMGDQVLRYVADHLAHAVGKDGAVGRLGGEEFVVMLPGAGLDEATAAIDRARAALAARIIRRSDDGTSMGRVSFSAGTASDKDGETADALVARADAALYDAKRMGRDRVVPAR